MSRLKIQRVRNGEIPSERIVDVKAADGTEEQVIVDSTQVQDDYLLVAEGGHHEEAPRSFFYPIWHAIKDTSIGKLYGFDVEKDHLGMLWFDAIGFSIIAAAVLVVCATIATKSYTKVPRGIQNVFEWIVGLLRGLVHGFIPGRQGDQYVPYLGSLFLFIFTMNMLGVSSHFRTRMLGSSITVYWSLRPPPRSSLWCVRESCPRSR